MQKLKCKKCQIKLPITSFSDEQLRRKSKRRCHSCVANTIKHQQQKSSVQNENDDDSSNSTLFHKSPENSSQENDKHDANSDTHDDDIDQHVERESNSTSTYMGNLAQNANLYKEITDMLAAPEFNNMDKAVKQEFAKISLLRIIKEQAKHIPAINGVNNNNNFTKMMYEETQIQPFTAKFPRNQHEFWEYINTMDRFKNEHDSIEESRLLHKIIKQTSIIIRNEWLAYKREYIAASDNNDLTQSDLNTFSDFQQFISKKLRIHPSIHYFLQQLGYIRSGYDENPEDTHNRIQYYLQSIETARTIYNSYTTKENLKLRTISDSEVIELYERVFIFHNADPTYNTNGKLNRKIKLRFTKFWRDTEQITIAKISKFIQDVHAEILPSSMIKAGVDGFCWRKIKSSLTIFQLRPMFHPLYSGNKRTLSVPAGSSSFKRRKIDRSTTPRCRHKSQCRTFIKTGSCKFFHTADELRQFRAKNNNNNNPTRSFKSRPQSLPSRRTNNRSSFKSFNRTQQHSRRNTTNRAPVAQRSNSNTQGFCRFNARCRKYQNGKCNLKHQRSSVICDYCKQRGHPKYQCLKLKSPRKQPTQYNPYTNPNPSIPTPANPQTLITKIGDQIYQQTWTPINNIPSTNVPNVPITPSSTQPPKLLTSLTNNTQNAINQFRNLDRQHKQIKQEIKALKQQQSYLNGFNDPSEINSYNTGKIPRS